MSQQSIQVSLIKSLIGMSRRHCPMFWWWCNLMPTRYSIRVSKCRRDISETLDEVSYSRQQSKQNATTRDISLLRRQWVKSHQPLGPTLHFSLLSGKLDMFLKTSPALKRKLHKFIKLDKTPPELDNVPKVPLMEHSLANQGDRRTQCYQCQASKLTHISNMLPLDEDLLASPKTLMLLNIIGPKAHWTSTPPKLVCAH